MATRLDVSEYDVTTYSRDEFVKDVWHCRPGEHVTILGATRNGKTYLAHQLLHETATPDLQAVVLVMKPRDMTVSKFAKVTGFRIVRDWPPSRITVIQQKPAGYILWPKESGNPEYDDENHARIFQRAIRDNYQKGKRITFADEVYSLENEYGLRKDLVRVWSKGGSMENGLWVASQRPAFISRWAYQAQHLFLSNDPDKDTQKRYGEIGAGVDPDLVRALTAKLKMYQWVYINRDDRTLCIVDR